MASASKIWMPLGMTIGDGTTDVRSSTPSMGEFERVSGWSLASSRTRSPTFSAVTRSSYHFMQQSRTLCNPSNTHTVSAVHSTPFAEMNVLKIDPNRLASAPKAPMYRDKSCSCGGEVEGYDGGSETRTRIITSSWGVGRLYFIIWQLSQ